MQIKQKYIDRVVMQIENEIDNIFDVGSCPDVNYKVEQLIEGHVFIILHEIKEMYKELEE